MTENIVAFLYGPIVLAGQLGTEGMPSSYAPNQSDFNKVVDPNVPVLIADVNNVTAHIEPVAGKPLVFQTKGIGKPKDITLIPFYRTHHSDTRSIGRFSPKKGGTKKTRENSR